MSRYIPAFRSHICRYIPLAFLGGMYYSIVMSTSNVTKVYTIRLTGKQITLIVAALVSSKLPGAKLLADKILDRASK